MTDAALPPPPAPDGPAQLGFAPVPCTANAESCFSTFAAPHSGQATAWSVERTALWPLQRRLAGWSPPGHRAGAALALVGTGIAAIDHAGSYSCRRLYGRSEGSHSEHATADAIAIPGFKLADGRRVSVLRDWRGDTSEARFLRDVRDGSCRLFSTVLSPDYNAAHADHLHLDQAERGSFGWRGCK